MESNAQFNLIKSLSAEDKKWLLKKGKENTLPVRPTDQSFSVIKQRLQKTDDDVMTIISIIRSLVAKKQQSATRPSLPSTQQTSGSRQPSRVNSGSSTKTQAKSQQFRSHSPSSTPLHQLESPRQRPLPALDTQTATVPLGPDTLRQQQKAGQQPLRQYLSSTTNKSSGNSSSSHAATPQPPAQFSESIRTRQPAISAPVRNQSQAAEDREETVQHTDDNPTEPDPIRPEIAIPLPDARLSNPPLKSEPFYATQKSESSKTDEKEGLFEDLHSRAQSLRRDSTSSNVLPRSFRSSTRQLDPPSIFQTPHHPASDQHLLRAMTPASPTFSSPAFKRRREETCDSGLGSSMRDSVEHIRSDYPASYASSVSGSVAQNVFDGASQISAGFMERMNATSDILRNHWDELNSVKVNLSTAEKDLQLEKKQVATLQKQVSSLTDVLTAVQAEKTVALSNIAELQADNSLLQRRNDDLVSENTTLRAQIQEAALPKPKRVRIVRGPDDVPKPRIQTTAAINKLKLLKDEADKFVAHGGPPVRKMPSRNRRSPRLRRLR
ncbi:hypothetical protein BJ508DRAFT_324450 [Ascobolus immersus RN42]|uniref:Uncharacterized protein n=1 Tax=Ascobolus immersus RN42 TaxID=1160509 RepID=A0A3N4IBE5_ASCIM|nr:hypothetical protein BJ508DRAFT_324450 [Ascobolus immersus RN42]